MKDETGAPSPYGKNGSGRPCLQRIWCRAPTALTYVVSNAEVTVLSPVLVCMLLPAVLYQIASGVANINGGAADVTKVFVNLAAGLSMAAPDASGRRQTSG